MQRGSQGNYAPGRGGRGRGRGAAPPPAAFIRPQQARGGGNQQQQARGGGNQQQQARGGGNQQARGGGRDADYPPPPAGVKPDVWYEQQAIIKRKRIIEADQAKKRKEDALKKREEAARNAHAHQQGNLPSVTDDSGDMLDPMTVYTDPMPNLVEDAEHKNEKMMWDPPQVSVFSDLYVEEQSLFVAASQALTWARQWVSDSSSANQMALITHAANSAEYIAAATRVHVALRDLTYTRSFYTMLAGERMNVWRYASGFKFGVKDKLRYLSNRYLLTVSTKYNGQPYEWKMDFTHDGAGSLNMHDEGQVTGLVRSVSDRVAQYRKYLDITYAQQRFKRQRAPFSAGPEGSDASAFAMKLMDRARRILSDAAGLPGPGTVKDTARPAPLQGLFFSDLQPDVHPPERDADVTHNAKQKVEYTKVGQVDEGGPRIYLQVYRYFPARRQQGLHVHFENEDTIDFINRMLPLTGCGWHEIVASADSHRFHFKLTPWQQPRATHVQPFCMVSRQSPLKMDHARGDPVAIPDQLLDFRKVAADDYEVRTLTPYLITGKGSEIDGMVHSLYAVQAHPDALGMACRLAHDDALKSEDPQTALLKHIRAYYSTDGNARAGNLSPYGERSVFFVSVLGHVAGVVMSSPSIQYVNHASEGDLFELPHRRRAEEQEQPSRGRHVPQPPPPAGQQPDQVLAALRQVQQQLANMQGGGGGGGGNSDVQRRMDELERKLREAKDTTIVHQHLPPVAAFVDAESNKEYLPPDPAGGWSAAVTSENADMAPVTLVVSGIPNALFKPGEEDTYYLKDLKFQLDQDLAQGRGTLIYHASEQGSSMRYSMMPYPYPARGTMGKRYDWTIVYKDKANADFIRLVMKEKDSSVLIAHQRDDVLWSADLETWGENVPNNAFKVKITVPEGVQRVPRSDTWKARNKTSYVKWEYDNDKKKWNPVPDLEIILEVPTAHMVQGIAGNMYHVGLFRPFSYIPYCDRSGLLPLNVELHIEELELKNKDQTTSKRENIMWRFTLLDCRTPEYQCLYTSKSGYEYDIRLTTFYNHEEQRFVWGLKSNYGVDRDHKFFAWLNYRRYRPRQEGQDALTLDGVFDQALITREQVGRWHFHTWINSTEIREVLNCRLQWQDVQHTRFIRREPNWSNPQPSLLQTEELNGIYAPLTSDDCKRQFEGLSRANTKTISEFHAQLVKDGRAAKCGLPLYDPKFPQWVNKYRGRPVTPMEAPLHIVLHHDWLNGELAQRRGVHYSSDDYNLYLVDPQGPVWVSKNGKFMVCPYSNQQQKLKTWSLRVWNEAEAYYDVFAVKDAKTRHLISDPDFDRTHGLTTKTARGVKSSNIWRFQKMWNNYNPTADQMKDNKFAAMDVTMVKTAVAVAPGDAHAKNPYNLHKRLPDYTVELTEEQAAAAAKRDPYMMERAHRYLDRHQHSQAGAEGAGEAQAGAEEAQAGAGEAQAGAGEAEAGESQEGLSLAFLGMDNEERGNAKLVMGDKEAKRLKDKQEKERQRFIEEERKKREAAAPVDPNQKVPDASDFPSLQELSEKEKLVKSFAANVETKYAKEEVKETSKMQQTQVMQFMERNDKELKDSDSAETKQRKTLARFLTQVKKLLFDEAGKAVVNTVDRIMEKPNFIETFTDSKMADESLKEFQEVARGIAQHNIERKKAEYEKMIEEKQGAKITSTDSKGRVVGDNGFNNGQEIKYPTLLLEMEEQELIDAVVSKASTNGMVTLSHRVSKKIEHMEALNKAKYDEQLIQYKKKQKAKKEAEKAARASAQQQAADELDPRTAEQREVDDLLRDDPAEVEAEEVDVDEIEIQLQFNSMQEVPPIITEVTPWTNFMQMYADFLYSQLKYQTDVKMDNLRKQKMYNREVQRQEEENKKREKEHREQTRKNLEQTRQKKKDKEEDARAQYEAIKPTEAEVQGGEIHTMINSVSVFENAELRSSLPLDLTFTVDGLNFDFHLHNAYNMMYTDNAHGLILQPFTIKDENQKDFFAWKLQFKKQGAQDTFTLAVKALHPQWLIKVEQDEKKKVHELPWRFSVHSMALLSTTNLTQLKTVFQKMDKEKNEKHVYYKEMRCSENIAFYLKNDVLPVFRFEPAYVSNLQPQRAQLSGMDPGAVIQSVSAAVWEEHTLRGNTQMLFEVPDTLFLTYANQVNEKVTKAYHMSAKNTDDVDGFVWQGVSDTNSYTSFYLRPSQAADSEGWELIQKIDGSATHVTLLRKKGKFLLNDGQEERWDIAEEPAEDAAKKLYSNAFTRSFAFKDKDSPAIVVSTASPPKKTYLNPDTKSTLVSELVFKSAAKYFTKASEDLMYLRSHPAQFDGDYHLALLQAVMDDLEDDAPPGRARSAEVKPQFATLLPLQPRKAAGSAARFLRVTAPLPGPPAMAGRHWKRPA